MTNEIRLIYIGILKYGFKGRFSINIMGLLDYIANNKLCLDEIPTVSINRGYDSRIGNNWFWDIQLVCNHRYLVIYFDSEGCHYSKFFDFSEEKLRLDGDINEYSDLSQHFKWLLVAR